MGCIVTKCYREDRAPEISDKDEIFKKSLLLQIQQTNDSQEQSVVELQIVQQKQEKVDQRQDDQSKLDEEKEKENVGNEILKLGKREELQQDGLSKTNESKMSLQKKELVEKMDENQIINQNEQLGQNQINLCDSQTKKNNKKSVKIQQALDQQDDPCEINEFEKSRENQINNTPIKDLTQVDELPSISPLEHAIEIKYNKKEILFFHDPESVEEAVSGVNGEFSANFEKAEKLLNIFKEVNGVLVSRVRGDGNCFFRSLASNYLLTLIGLSCQKGMKESIINQIFDEMQLIPLLIPTNQSATLGSTFSREEISNLVHSNLKRMKTNLLKSENLIQTIVFSLNDPFVDFSLQVWIKSLLVHGLKQAIDNQIFPLDSLISLQEFEQLIAPLNCESGDDILFLLISCIFNSELSIVRVQMNGSFDSSKLQPLEPGLPKSCLSLNIPIALWYKTGHYYILYTQQQMELLN